MTTKQAQINMEKAREAASSAMSSIGGGLSKARSSAGNLLSESPMARTVAATGAGGAGLAAILALLHEYKNEQRLSQIVTGEDDKDTITVRVPRRAGKRASEKNASIIQTFQNLAKNFTEGGGAVPFAGKATAAVAAPLVTYRLVTDAYRRRLKKKLKAEEDRAREDMTTAFLRDSKRGSVVDDIMGEFETKTAQKSGTSGVERASSAFFGAPLLVYLLATGGSAYMTKRLLDAKADEQESKIPSAPRQKRIVFQTVDGGELDDSHVASVLPILTDAMRPVPRLLDRDDVKQAMVEAEVSRDDIDRMLSEGLTTADAEKLAQLGGWKENLADIGGRLGRFAGNVAAPVKSLASAATSPKVKRNFANNWLEDNASWAHGIMSPHITSGRMDRFLTPEWMARFQSLRKNIPKAAQRFQALAGQFAGAAGDTMSNFREQLGYS